METRSGSTLRETTHRALADGDLRTQKVRDANAAILRKKIMRADGLVVRRAAAALTVQRVWKTNNTRAVGWSAMTERLRTKKQKKLANGLVITMLLVNAATFLSEVPHVEYVTTRFALTPTEIADHSCCCRPPLS